MPTSKYRTMSKSNRLSIHATHRTHCAVVVSTQPPELAEMIAKSAVQLQPWHVAKAEHIRGNHLSNTTCLTHVFFKSGESFGNN